MQLQVTKSVDSLCNYLICSGLLCLDVYNLMQGLNFPAFCFASDFDLNQFFFDGEFNVSYLSMS